MVYTQNKKVGLMMEKFWTLLDKILPLLSTLLGAGITYFVTVLSKKRDIRDQTRTKARDEYWVPLCRDTESLQCLIQNFTKKDGDMISFFDIENCTEQLQSIKAYQDPGVRSNFFDLTRGILDDFLNNVQEYEKELDDSIKKISDDFTDLYEGMLKCSHIFQRNGCVSSAILLKKEFADEVKEYLLIGKKLYLMGNVKDIWFYRNDFWDSFNAKLSMYDDETDFCTDVWCAIHDLGRKPEDFNLTEEQKLGLEILDYEYEKIDESIGEKIFEGVDQDGLRAKYLTVIESLNQLHDELIKNIDEHTIL